MMKQIMVIDLSLLIHRGFPFYIFGVLVYLSILSKLLFVTSPINNCMIRHKMKQFVVIINLSCIEVLKLNDYIALGV